jgi:uracil-DNA glycosylase family 4
MTEHKIVPASGPKNSKYVIVAEQPGRVEVERGEPFVGPAGENLNECLFNARIPRGDCYLTNVIKDLLHPLGYYIKLANKKFTVSDAGQFYLEVLRKELEQTSAHIIIACGNVALWALTGRIGITSWRGSVIESSLLPGRKVIGTFHPATYTQEKLFRDPKLFLNRYIISHDFQRARAESEYPEIRRLDRQIKTQPSFHDAMEFMYRLEDRTIIYYDIELYGNEMSCISLAGNETEGMCIPFIDQNGPYFSIEEECRIMLQLEKLLIGPAKKCGHNIIFDSHFLHDRYGIVTNNRDDTMIAQGILYPEYKKRLEFVTSMWTDIPYYKNDGKIWLKGGSNWENGWRYNVLDSLSCASAFPKQVELLEKRGNYDAYNRQVELIEPLTYMMEHGIRIDKTAMQTAYNDTAEELQMTLQLLGTLMPGINVNSPKQLRTYFYGEKRIEPVVNKYNKITVDESALRELAERGHKETLLILDARKKAKSMKTFLNVQNIDADGRMRCYYNPVGTKYGRISSSKNIYGTGMNLHNVPMQHRSYFVADPGYIIYSLDLSQAENRIVAYVGNITQMIDIFERGLDMHRQTGSLIFQKPYEKISDEPRSCSIGSGLHSERDWAKRANHAFNYGFGARSFARLHEIPYRDAKWIYDAYHSAYPGIKGSYWRYVEQCLRKDRTLETLFGRRIQFLQKWTEQLLHEAYSAIPQGTVGEMINEWGIKFIYYNEDPVFEPVQILTQVHDSVDFQIPLDLPVQEHAIILRAVINELEKPLRFKGSSFTIPADLTINLSLNKKEKRAVNLKATEIPTDIYEFGDVLEESWEKILR